MTLSNFPNPLQFHLVCVTIALRNEFNMLRNQFLALSKALFIVRFFNYTFIQIAICAKNTISGCLNKMINRTQRFLLNSFRNFFNNRGLCFCAVAYVTAFLMPSPLGSAQASPFGGSCHEVTDEGYTNSD